MIMAAATHGDVLIKNCIPIHMESVSAKLCDAGAIITEGDDWLRVTAPDELRAINLKTMTYPGYPTDLQQPISAMLTLNSATAIWKKCAAWAPRRG